MHDITVRFWRGAEKISESLGGLPSPPTTNLHPKEIPLCPSLLKTPRARTRRSLKVALLRPRSIFTFNSRREIHFSTFFATLKQLSSSSLPQARYSSNIRSPSFLEPAFDSSGYPAGCFLRLRKFPPPIRLAGSFRGLLHKADVSRLKFSPIPPPLLPLRPCSIEANLDSWNRTA